MYNFRLKLILFFLVALAPFAQAQFQDSVRVSVQNQRMSAIDLLSYLTANYNVNFRYKHEWLDGIQLNLDIKDQPISQAMEATFNELGFFFIYREPYYVVFVKNGTSSLTINTETLKETDLISLGEVNREITEAVLSGQILGGEDNLKLRGVTVTGVESGISTVSDEAGRYKIKLPVGFQTLLFKSIEFDDLELSLSLNSSSELNINLYQNVTQLGGVVVTAEAPDENITQTVTGVERIDIEEIKKQPALFGQPDVIKSLTTLPGVSVTGESSAGFNVRGSGTGANLILLDNGIIFNPSHLFGVFSSFTADVISSVDLYKGTIPSRYGGRLASVLDVKLKSGNKQRVTGGGGAGLISSNFNIEVPVIKNKSSFVSSVRAAYPNYLINSIANRDLKDSKSFFGDFSFKYDHIIDKQNIIFATVYGSNNKFTIRDEVGYDYNNLLGVVNWNHIYNDKLSSSLNYSLSQYSYTLDEKLGEDLSYSLFSVIENQKLDLDFTYEGIENHLIDFGFNSIFHNLKPGNFDPDETALLLDLSDLNKENALESGLHIGDEITISNQLSAYVGLRFSHFSSWFEENEQTYTGLEPRFSFNYQLGNSSAIKAGFNRVRQYIHLISNTSAVTPLDIWKLSNEALKPTISNQFTLGYFRNLDDNNFEVSVEGYYKDITDLVDYKNGANLFGNPSIDDELIQGTGEAYGLEVNLEKTKGKATGRLSYTYSRTFITVDEENSQESINGGNPYPTNFDQPHNLTFQSSIQTSRRFRVSANFIYTTGRPITFPRSVYGIEGVTIANYSIRNGQRIPDYHRLDLSFHLATTLKKNKNVEANWTLTLYNVYSRRNAYSVFFRTSETGNQINAFKLSVIGQIVPALSYTFKF